MPRTGRAAGAAHRRRAERDGVGALRPHDADLAARRRREGHLRTRRRVVLRRRERRARRRARRDAARLGVAATTGRSTGRPPATLFVRGPGRADRDRASSPAAATSRRAGRSTERSERLTFGRRRAACPGARPHARRPASSRARRPRTSRSAPFSTARCQKSSSVRPSASTRATRTTASCVTTSAGARGRQRRPRSRASARAPARASRRPRTRRARGRRARRDSAAGSLAAISSRSRPSHVPCAISISRSSVSTRRSEPLGAPARGRGAAQQRRADHDARDVGAAIASASAKAWRHAQRA